MAGIYIHIPFCRKACHYCNFHFSTNLNLRDAVVSSIIKEIELSIGYLENENTIESVYFGGGTPSLLTGDELAKILFAIKDKYQVLPNAEITMEANPDDMSQQNMQTWFSLGINRLSVGVQSFFNTHLQYMNRVHSAFDAKQALQAASFIGFENISIDLIYGVPKMTDLEWYENLEITKSLDVSHLSCYALTVEPETALAHLIKNGKSLPVDDQMAAQHFDILCLWSKENNWQHYEISNLSKPGHNAIHNSNYWKAKKYLGIGPSAHSFDGKSRRWNVSNNSLYIKSIASNIIPFDEEVLTNIQMANEYIMTSLRTIAGLDLNILESIVPEQMDAFRVELYANQNKLNIINNYVSLKDGFRFFADGIAASLFF